VLLLDRGVSAGRDRLVREYAMWMSSLNTRADLTLRCRAMIPARPHGAPHLLSLNDDLLRSTIVRALNRLNATRWLPSVETAGAARCAGVDGARSRQRPHTRTP